jgi:hypothetical protein
MKMRSGNSSPAATTDRMRSMLLALRPMAKQEAAPLQLLGEVVLMAVT